MLPKGKEEEEEFNFAIRYRRIGTLGKRMKRTGHCREPLVKKQRWKLSHRSKRFCLLKICTI
jgi:hypothetical protein